MGTRKEMTIGVTINLDNYENIRLDVTGEVESEGDVSELAAFLDGVLAGIGREDEATAERVDHYRSRVFGSMYRKVHPLDDEGTRKRIVSSISDESTEELDADSIASCPVTGVEELLDVPEEREVVEVDTPDPILPYPGSPYVVEPDAGPQELPGADEPGVEEVVAEEFVADELVADEPGVEGVVAEEVVADELVADEPGVEEVVAEEVVADELVADEPGVDEVVAEEVVADELVADEPGAEEPVAGEVVADELVADESGAEEPVVEEPSAEGPGADRPGTGAAPGAAGSPGAAPRFLCEACGIEVSKVQHDVSHLFMNRTLCKQCMNTL